jgi:hypothetical protein
MRPETIENRIIGDRVFHHVPTGNKPPRELEIEVAAENEKIDREALTTPFEHPSTTMQRDMQESANFDALFEPFQNSVWVEKNPPENTEKLKLEMKNCFWGIRPNVMGEATARDQRLLRSACIPFYEHEPEKPKIEVRGGRKRIFEVPANTKPIRETFPLSFFTLSEFLAKHKPVNDMDVSVLETLSALDVGHEHEARIEQPKPVSVEESIGKLVAALTAASKPATS